MKKKSFTMLLTALLTFSTLLAGCGGNNNNKEEAAAPTTSAENTTKVEETEAPKEEPTEIKIMLPLNTTETPPDRIKTEVEKLTNTKLTYQFYPADTYEEKLNSSFATGSLPQVTYLKNQTTFIQMKDAIKDGQFWEIGPLLSEFPNLSKMKPEILNNTKVDGKLYTLYIGRPLARQGIIYRKDWADKLGLAAPANVDELFEMAKAFTEQDPDGNGQKDTTGIIDRNELTYGAFKTVSSWFGTPNTWGEIDGKLAPEFTFPQYIETMDFFKKARDGGYMNQDFAATSKTDAVNMFTSGKGGLYIGGSMQDIDSLNKDTIKNFPDAVLDTHSMVAGPDGKFAQWMIPGYNNVVLFPKSAVKDEAELKKILAFFDAMMTPEVANLMYWGIEGVHYTVEDGKAKPADDKELIEREVKGFKDSVIGEYETNGMYQSYNVLPGRIHAEELVLENVKVGVPDPTAAMDSATYTEKGVELQQIITDATYKYIYGQIDKAGFEKEVENWKSRGGAKIIEEYNALYKK
ncbi:MULTISPECIES: extracellular solute-binding protein [Paenibacillus]|uniref:ABC transporter substrate-binding protein n=1 Tax=Paenibacillus odorifer TaxID=189426 RepID=A0A1R0Z281_9BACL|nr:extracellular solute-binding protein [Paenibacillus odorifer]AWV32851.1 ABC transporter substrate-binding protein [Paenibacillus odorifer]OME15647.1 ABC transporter substrate-binding protein [Paenibacillus odorifer]OZQ77598.1 ABC transporter substrate-binding protein [Paenibacillus odorifer]